MASERNSATSNMAMSVRSWVTSQKSATSATTQPKNRAIASPEPAGDLGARRLSIRRLGGLGLSKGARGHNRRCPLRAIGETSVSAGGELVLGQLLDSCDEVGAVTQARRDLLV